METVSIHDKKFRMSIPANTIRQRILKMAEEMNRDLQAKEVVFIAVLNGAFVFAAELIQKITIKCKISFLKLASYENTGSAGKIKKLIGLNEILTNKTVVILEDIVDTGNTLEATIEEIESHSPAEIKIASLLMKPDVYTHKYTIDYVGFLIPAEFVIGYGLDYEGYGRNLESIYTIIK